MEIYARVLVIGKLQNEVMVMIKIIKGDCPHGFIDFDDFKEDCAFHTHGIVIKRDKIE